MVVVAVVLDQVTDGLTYIQLNKKNAPFHTYEYIYHAILMLTKCLKQVQRQQ